MLVLESSACCWISSFFTHKHKIFEHIACVILFFGLVSVKNNNKTKKNMVVMILQEVHSVIVHVS